MESLRKGAFAGERYRVIVSTDIGGTDPDDYQSMVHYLLYSNLFDTEGLISSPWGDGRAADILEVIDQYEVDFPRLQEHSADYPSPDHLRGLVKQGVIDLAPYKGYSRRTAASDWIIQCAQKDDPRPIYFLGWGAPDDLAQALHDEPGIVSKLRVYFIGGPNKKWGVNAYEYIRENFPDLWMIENNSTYRGWFVGGNQEADLGNRTFVSNHIGGSGALGNYFATHLGGIIKMGDTPSVTYLLNGSPEDPETPGWGGRFVKVNNRPKSIFKRNTTVQDRVEVFSVLEFSFNGPDTGAAHDQPVFSMEIRGQSFPGYYCGNGEYRIRFMPKSTGDWSYFIVSEIPALHGQSGEFTCVKESEAGRESAVERYPNWWSDCLDEKDMEEEHMGARTVSMWRGEFLRDFQSRLRRCKGSLEVSE